MAVGLAVVGTRVSGTEDMVEDGVNGLLVEPGDADALASAVARVLVDPARAAALGRRACADVRRRCSLEAVTDAYLDLYRSRRA
jgi:glycosyltransferase involved in cell wall biosynthesis